MQPLKNDLLQPLRKENRVLIMGEGKSYYHGMQKPMGYEIGGKGISKRQLCAASWRQ